MKQGHVVHQLQNLIFYKDVLRDHILQDHLSYIPYDPLILGLVVEAMLDE
jgi:hypothetical protein